MQELFKAALPERPGMLSYSLYLLCPAQRQKDKNKDAAQYGAPVFGALNAFKFNFEVLPFAPGFPLGPLRLIR